MKETERAQRRAVRRLRKRWALRFFRVSSRSVAQTQKRQRQATALSKRYCTLKASRMRPMSRPSRITKKMTSSSPRLWLMRARGSRQQIIRPQPAASRPKSTLPVGNSRPSTQTSVRVPSTWLRSGFRFSARSLRMTLQIGATAEITGTSMPMKSPPRTASEVGEISCRQPKKPSKAVVTPQRAAQARGQARRLARATYLRAPARILATTKARSAPMTLRRAKSKFFRSTPILNMLFIIRVLSRNSEKIIRLNITPMNIPMIPIFFKFPAMGMLVSTEKMPAFSSNSLPTLPRCQQVSSQLGFEQISTRLGKLTVASEAKCPKSKSGEFTNLTKEELSGSMLAFRQV